MNFTNELGQLRQRINQLFIKERNELVAKFNRIKGDVEKYVNDSNGAYKSLKSFSQQQTPKREYEPEGLAYGYEIINFFNPQNNINLPLIHPFYDKSATAFEVNSGCAHLLFNFALRSIISYPMGDCNVYMVDSNVSGDFNQLSKINTSLDDAEADKPYFHYITSTEESDKLLSYLSCIMDSNVRNYVSMHKDLRDYNSQNQKMHVPYHFVFINNITATYPSKNQLDKIIKLIHSNNAQKAGIFFFYTYDKNMIKDDPESYYDGDNKALKMLLDLSYVMERPKQIYSNSELQQEAKASPEIAEKVLSFVECQKPPLTIMSFKEQIQAMLAKDTLWNPPFKREEMHLPFVVGFQNAVTPKVVDVCFKGISPHIFIGGKTGSGKSILLHNFIVNGALQYSPEQLQFYLVDMKGGVSFAPYKNLPHVVALSASSSRHYAMSLLELFAYENYRRLQQFKRAGAASLDDYNGIMSKQGKPQLPYLFGIIDEFQGLFDRNDVISKNAEAKIEELHKLSRAAGIFLALCTQQAPGNVNRSQVGIKMSLVCNPNDSVTLIGNTGASRLRGIGRAIINTHPTGEEKYNQEFQVAFIHERKELPVYVDKIREIYLKQHGGKDPLDHLVYDDNDNASRLPEWVMEKIGNQADSFNPFICIGIPGFFRKEHVKFYLHRDSQSNIAMVGNDRPAALRIAGLIAIQVALAYRKTGSKVYISDLQKTFEPTYGKLKFLDCVEGIFPSGVAELKDTMKEVYQMLTERKENPAKSQNEPEVLYEIIDLKPDSNFSDKSVSHFSFSDEPAEKSIMEMLKDIIEDGPDYGVHVLAYSFNYANMETLLNSFNNSLLPKMEIKIGLRGGNSSKLLRFISGGEIVENYGEAVIRMPEDMGLKYADEDNFGDPFIVYDTIDDKRFEGSVWDNLFKNLPNKED